MGKLGTKLRQSLLVGAVLVCWAAPGLAQQYNLRTYGTDDGLDPYVEAISGDSLGYLWVATRAGRYRYDGFRFVARPDSVDPARPGPSTISTDTLRALGFPLPGAAITTALRTRNGRTWVGTQRHGALVYLPRGGQWLRLDETTGLGRNHVTALYEDRWGYLWIGTRGGGLSRYAGRQFVQYSRAEGLRSRTVYDVTAAPGGGLWLALGSAGIARFTGGTFEHYGPAEGYPPRDARTLLTDRDGALWIGTAGDGLYLFDSLGFHRIGPVDSLARLSVNALAQDRLGNYWLATAADGIWQLSPPDSSYRVPALKRYGLTEGLPDARVSALHLDRRARVWVATADGLAVLDNGQFRVVDALAGETVTALTESPAGRLYASTARGLWSMDLYGKNAAWQALDVDDLPRGAALLAADSLGRLWLGAPTGLYRLAPGADARTGRLQRYTRAEGFRGGEVLVGAALAVAGGGLWLGTTNGLTYYRPGTDRRNGVPPVVDLRDIRLFYESLADTRYAKWLTPDGGLRSGLRLPPTKNHLGFAFFAPNLPAPEGLRYQWKLLGAESDWSPLTTRRDAMYPNLPPGDYDFRVRACNEDQRCGAVVSVPFTVRAPWWQHWWVAASAVALGVLLLWGIFALRLRQIRRRNARAQQRLQLDNQLLALEQKARRLQMNPHFIFNALHTVQGLIAQNEPALARRQLSRFAKLMRRVLEHSIHDQISVADEIATLDTYLAIEHTSRGGRFTYTITTDLAEDPEALFLPPMLVQPFVENALQHGLSTLENGQLLLHFTQQKDQLYITVRDNGIGRAAAAQRPAKSNPSRALTVTRDRLRLLGPTATLTIHDLTDTTGQPQGTEVRLILPLS